MTQPNQYVIDRVTVTPDMAREWLKTNTNNRTIRRRNVESLAREMKDDRWQFNFELVMFGESGRLLNGQHRLEAVILADKSIELPVVRNVPDEVQATLDQGARRTAADDLMTYGFHNCHRLAAAARIILMWDKALPTRSAGVTKTEIVEFVRDTPSLADFVSMVNGRKGGGGGDLIPVSALAAVGWMATHKPAYKAKFNDFLVGLQTGAGLAADSPILTLRNYGINMRQGHTLQGVAWFGLVATAWNDFVNGRSRKVLRPENYNWPAEVAGYSVKRDPKKVRSTFTYIGPSAQIAETNVLKGQQPIV